MSTYLLRNIPDDLWRRVKAQAALEKITIRDMIVNQVEEWVESEKNAVESKTRKGGG